MRLRSRFERLRDLLDEMWVVGMGPYDVPHVPQGILRIAQILGVGTSPDRFKPAARVISSRWRRAHRWADTGAVKELCLSRSWSMPVIHLEAIQPSTQSVAGTSVPSARMNAVSGWTVSLAWLAGAVFIDAGVLSAVGPV